MFFPKKKQCMIIGSSFYPNWWPFYLGAIFFAPPVTTKTPHRRGWFNHLSGHIRLKWCHKIHPENSYHTEEKKKNMKLIPRIQLPSSHWGHHQIHPDFLVMIYCWFYPHIILVILEFTPCSPFFHPVQCGAPQWCERWLTKTPWILVRYLRTINHSEIGVMWPPT